MDIREEKPPFDGTAVGNLVLVLHMEGTGSAVARRPLSTLEEMLMLRAMYVCM